LGQLSNLSVSGTIEGGTFSGTLSQTAQNTITQLGNVQSLTVANSISAANITVSGTITGGIFSGTLSPGTIAGITGLNASTFNSITVTNSINAGNITVSGTV